MPVIHYDNLGQYGIIDDTDEYDLPHNAWTSGRNVRFIDNKVAKFKGHEQVFGTPLVAPYYATPIVSQGNYFWHYAGLNDICATDGTNHATISETSGGYNAIANINWNGGPMAGGINVLNNGFDAPTYWAGTVLADKYAALPNWPSGMTARVLRPYKQFLVAGDIDEGSGRNGSLLIWSHPADVGSVPSSWDYTDPTKDAGRYQIGQTIDYIIDFLVMRDINMIYKENSTWSMQYVGGNSKFRFRQVFSQIGAVSRRCIKEFRGKHLVLGSEDVILHDGNSETQILAGKWKRWLFNNIDPDSYDLSFITINHAYSEIWICIPQVGYTYPNIALVWCWKDNTTTIRELPNGTAHIAWGIVEPTQSFTFDDDSGTFDSAVGIFDEQTYAGAKRHLLMCNQSASKLYRADTTEQFDGVNMISYVQRNSLPIGRQYKDGTIKPDYETFKHITEVWPVINGTTGGVVNIYIGQRKDRGDTVSWKGPYPFVINQDRKVDVRVAAPIIDIKFESTDDIEWDITSYKLVYSMDGVR